jgi:hypothetical protein
LSRWRYAAVNDAGRVVGQEHHSAKLSDDDVDLIHELRAAGLSYRQIALKFDDAVRVSKSMVRYVCTGGRRAQTVMGHRRVPPRRFGPADIDEFELCTQHWDDA